MLPGLARKQVFVPQRIGQCWSQGGPDETPSSVSMMIQSKAQEAIAKFGQPVMHAEVEKPKPIAAAAPAKRVAKQKNKVAQRASGYKCYKIEPET